LRQHVDKTLPLELYAIGPTSAAVTPARSTAVRDILLN